jgi:hypothetical protein
MTDKETLPYKAINVFIERDYLETVLRTVLVGIKKQPKEEQIKFTNFLRKYVSILGFRDPSRAPLPLQVNAYASAFEEKDEVIPYSLSLWVKMNKKLPKVVKKWLEDDGWKDLALERDFEEQGGFLSVWPKKMTFDKLVKKFNKDNPDVSIERDDLILLVLWISGQLPKEQSDI